MQSDRMKLTVFFSTTASLTGSDPGTLCEPRYLDRKPGRFMDPTDPRSCHRTKPHVSVAKLTRFYYVACLSEELGQRPLARVIAGRAGGAISVARAAPRR